MKAEATGTMINAMNAALLCVRWYVA